MSEQSITDRKAALEILIGINREKQAFDFDPNEMKSFLKGRVLGQDSIIDQVVDHVLVSSAQEKDMRVIPIARMLFLGPPGTGKTELATQIAEFLFGDSKAAVRFDCKTDLAGSEQQATIELVGGQPIWQGAKPGRLTSSVKSKPNQVVIFDEMEKAPFGVWNNLLQVLEKPARTRDLYTGDEVDFRGCIFVFTGNALWKDMVQLKRTIDDPEELQNACMQKLVDQKVISPEMRRRFDYVCVFDSLEDDILLDVLEKKIVREAASYGLSVEFVEPTLFIDIFMKTKRTSGEDGSVIGTFGTVITKVLGPHFASAKRTGLKKIRCQLNADGTPEIVTATDAAS